MLGMNSPNWLNLSLLDALLVGLAVVAAIGLVSYATWWTRRGADGCFEQGDRRPLSRGLLRRLIPGIRTFEVAKRRADAKAEMAQIERLHDHLVDLRRKALQHLERGSDSSRRALDGAYGHAEFLARHSRCEQVRTAAVRAVRQCIRAAELFEANASGDVPSALVAEIEEAVAEAKAALLGRVRDLDVIVRGRGDSV